MRMRLLLLTVLCSGCLSAEPATETIGRVEVLPERYPPHWVLAHDIAFTHIMDAKTVVLDLDAQTPAAQFKGMFNHSFAAFLGQATTRPEIYVAETYYSRGTRGERTDVLTIYDTRTLSPAGEVILETDRAILLPQKYTLQLTRDESLALIYNFTPAMSVSVVDPVGRRYVDAVPIPGCAAIYPTGSRGFSSLCGDGTLYTVQLDDEGQVASTARSEAFFDVDEDPLMEKPAWHDGRAWFPSFGGDWYPVNFNGTEPVIGEAWSMLDEDTADWRPGALAPAAAGPDGRVYALVHPEGGEGTHRDPGIETWVFDPAGKRRLARYRLRSPGLSIAFTRDVEATLMIVVNVEMELDVYDASTGEHVKTLAGFGGETPLLVYGAR